MQMVPKSMVPVQTSLPVSKIIYLTAFWMPSLVFCAMASNAICAKSSPFFSSQADIFFPWLFPTLVNNTALHLVIPIKKLTVIFDSALSFFSPIPNWWTSYEGSLSSMLLLSLLPPIYFRLSSFFLPGSLQQPSIWDASLQSLKSPAHPPWCWWNELSKIQVWSYHSHFKPFSGSSLLRVSSRLFRYIHGLS